MRNKLLFVEGIDDFHFICNFLECLGIKNIEVIKTEGKSKLKLAISSYLKSNSTVKFESISVILDADTSFDGTEESIRDILGKCGLFNNIKHANPPLGDGPKTSCFIMPGKDKSGAIEDLILEYCNKQNLFTYIEHYFSELDRNDTEIKSHDINYSYPKNDKKAKLQVYLSSQYDSDTRIGTSIKKNILDISHGDFDEIRNYLLSI
ncbi:DUF3226 domain-containing protein [Morganella morganii]|uniref:DUF3226 domain-containing protein n=1 Tax=Morganella morganii TaxID=582 RepID=UPI00235EE350|nr:DUF3226 domain-containing protein [Morganella morganii]